MLRIFGHYRLGDSQNTYTTDINNVFRVSNMFIEYTAFNEGNLSVTYERYNNPESNNYYHIDKNKGLACFIVGNIHAYDSPALKYLTGGNVAEFIIERYLKIGLNFVKHLRGEFNIIIKDKESVFLINDKLGLSPLYTYKNDNDLLFCNEADPITWLNLNNQLDYASIAEFLIYGFVPNGKTFIKGLNNQPPASIIKLSNKNVSLEKYYAFEVTRTKGISKANIIKLVEDTFREAVKIRTNLDAENTFLDLTGGWDTRFILANLLCLRKRVITYTNKKSAEDLAIAEIITKKLNISHFIDCLPNFKSSDPRMSLDTVYSRNQKLNYFINQKDADQSEFNRLNACNFFTTARFTGLFGGEVLGNAPYQFEERVLINYHQITEKYLSRNLIKKALKDRDYNETTNNINKANNLNYIFINQVGRAYLNIHNLYGWEQPTTNIKHEALLPFTDSKFISLLSGLDYEQYLRGYRLYSILYKIYHAEYTRFPWTFTLMRKRNDLNDGTRRENYNKKNVNANYKDKEFINFLRSQNFLKDDQASLKHLNELYLLYNWLKIYKPVIQDYEL